LAACGVRLAGVAVVGERPTAWAVLGLLLVVTGVPAVVRNELAGSCPAQGHAAAPAGDAASSTSPSPTGP
jgi:DME family drug/metabolite transporter